VGQVVSLAGAGLLFGSGMILDANAGPPNCAPCDPANVPGFDRWIIRPIESEYSTASDALLIGLAAGTLGHTGMQDAGLRRVVMGLETVAWTMGITELSKALIGRNRPVLYTDDALAVADAVTNQRSMPSGHAATAFALATAYALNNEEVGIVPKILAFAGAASIGALRVAAAKHFPSDVLVGAAVGTATGFAVHYIRF
jgi:membrane-associated phospholipid phosphatase